MELSQNLLQTFACVGDSYSKEEQQKLKEYEASSLQMFVST